jgi:membrane protease subunit HflK
VTRWLIAVGLLLGYFASGVFVVGSSDRAVVRRFGRALPELRGSGLWWEPPWPFTRIDRVNVASVRAVSLQSPRAVDDGWLPELRATHSGWLTGDHNLLNVQATIQFHLRDEGVLDFLDRHREPEQLLVRMLEAAVTEATARSDVDTLSTTGLTALNRWLTTQLQANAEAARLGIEVDQVTLDRVDPPALVQADFLEVSNARSEAARVRQQAQTAAEQLAAETTAKTREQVSLAQRESQAARTAARAQAERFESLVDLLTNEARETGRPYATCRNAALQRVTTDTLSAALAEIKTQWVFDVARPVDLHLRPPNP